MLVYPVTSTGPCPRILWTLLLLAASLNVNAHNQSWDSPNCTELVSVPRGNRAVMTCNISNNFRDVTIELTANGKSRTIFNKTPPGNYSNDSWQLQIQGGWAQLVITDAQDIHSGLYSWRLWGCQKDYINITLNVNDLVAVNQEPESLQITAEPSSAVSVEVIIIIVFITTTIIITTIIIGIRALPWYKCSCSLKHHKYVIPVHDPSHRYSGNPYLILP